MKILHLSDTHGSMPELRDLDGVDVIVHSGDLMPNRSYGVTPVEQTFQTYWLETEMDHLRKWLGVGPPVLITPGNHDYVNPVPLLRRAGVNAMWLKDSAIEVGGVNFWGYPWVPRFGGWNYMASPEELRDRLLPAAERMDFGEIDVFVSHGPMYGVLDRNQTGERCGSKVLREVMQEARVSPKLFLCGHIHEAASVLGWSRGMIVSNAATTQRVLTV